MSKYVITAEFIHETNSFSKIPTTYQSFLDRGVYFGQDAIIARSDANTELGGFVSAAKQFDWTLNHVFSAAAQPAGLVQRETFERFVGLLIQAIHDNKDNIDGVLLALHGAMIVDGFEDGEAEVLRRIREVIGPRIPIAITLDLHANVSDEMCNYADIIVSYKTYPHVDMRIAGEHAGRILDRAMRGEIVPRTIRASRPMLEEANSGRTDIGAMIDRVNKMIAYEQVDGVLAVSLNAGFPTDISTFVGPTVLCTFDALHPTEFNQEAAHRQFLESVADSIWEQRHDVVNHFLSVDEACALAAQKCTSAASILATDGTRAGPLVIADYSDNPGAGSYGDGTNILSALIASPLIRNAALAPIVDAEAVKFVLTEYHVGDEIRPDKPIIVGGKVDPTHGGGPLTVVSGKIICISEDGKYLCTGPMCGGLTLCHGSTVVVQIAGKVDVVLISAPEQILDLSQFSAFGINPEERDVLVVKSMQHFRAAFEPIAESVVVCDSGCLATPDLRKLHFRKVQRPIFPLDEFEL